MAPCCASSQGCALISALRGCGTRTAPGKSSVYCRVVCADCGMSNCQVICATGYAACPSMISIHMEDDYAQHKSMFGALIAGACGRWTLRLQVKQAGSTETDKLRTCCIIGHLHSWCILHIKAVKINSQACLKQT